MASDLDELLDLEARRVRLREELRRIGFEIRRGEMTRLSGGAWDRLNRRLDRLQAQVARNDYELCEYIVRHREELAASLDGAELSDEEKWRLVALLEGVG